MNWTNFLLWLGGLYALYYLFTHSLRFNTSKNPAALKAAGHELTFSEPVIPLNAIDLLENKNTPSGPTSKGQTLSAPEMIASGGVLLKDVFSLARKEALVYLKEVSFNLMKQRIILLTVLVASALTTNAQPGIDEMNQAKQSLSSTFFPHWIAALQLQGVFGIFGAVRIYHNWQMGHPRIDQAVAGWFFAAIFMILAGGFLQALFGI